MQKELDELLGYKYTDTDNTRLTPGEIYVRLEKVKSLGQIIPYVDQAYYLRLEK
ncbi:hypothetical protein [Bacillus sp. T33-2]|uniref:hypothetical protein n=1 Tax=Bacillus sp. T33-2 TaxID=2054168 RepID=UPI0021554CDE|nr:hypothetical protein [Bacillus sp. T33-2]